MSSDTSAAAAQPKTHSLSAQEPSSFLRAIDRISDMLAIVASVAIGASVLLINYMVLSRLMGVSAGWEFELSIYLLFAATFLGSPYALKSGGHIGLDLLPWYLGGPAGALVCLSGALLGLAVCLFLGWEALGMTAHAFATGERSGSWWGPLQWPMKATFAIGMAFTALQYIAEIARLLRALRS